jgi:predicted lipid-binding transport protein (Tim44 family)
MFNSKRSWLTGLFTAVLLAGSLLAVGTADARMGGSFGSRGMRTYSSPAITTTAPRTTAPIQNSMTRPTTGTPGATAPYGTTAQNRGGFWSGIGGGFVGAMLGGMLFSGLFGSMFGMGFGGVGDAFWSIIQIVLIVWLVSWLIKRFRNRPAAAGGPFGGGYGGYEGPGYDPGPSRSPYESGYRGSESRNTGYGARQANGGQRDEIGLSNADYATFERMLGEVQAAFATENHKALRKLTTPEMVSFLSEELAENAEKGVRNEVRDLRFHEGELSESWREGDRDYATVALRWSAIDVLVDRQTGQVVQGNEHAPREAVELWTFVRERGGDWQLSAIQEAGR